MIVRAGLGNKQLSLGRLSKSDEQYPAILPGPVLRKKLFRVGGVLNGLLTFQSS